jgi:hypothetical protein
MQRHPITKRTGRRSRLSDIRVLSLFALSLCACGGDTAVPGPSIVGSYTATVLRVVPTGQPELDVLASGGSLTLDIAADHSTAGTLRPAR